MFFFSLLDWKVEHENIFNFYFFPAAGVVVSVPAAAVVPPVVDELSVPPVVVPLGAPPAVVPLGAPVVVPLGAPPAVVPLGVPPVTPAGAAVVGPTINKKCTIYFFNFPLKYSHSSTYNWTEN